MPLLNREDHAPRDWAAGASQPVFYTLQAPASLAPGDYEFVARVFDDQGQQQGVFGSSGAFAGIQASVAQVRVTAPPSQPAPDIPRPVAGRGPLAGYGELPQSVTAGDPLTLDLWWRAQQATMLEIILQIGEVQLPLMLETEGWRAGQLYQIRPTWRLPPDLAAGRQTLFLFAPGVNGQGRTAELGEVDVETRQRRYDLPPEVNPLQVQVGDLALLQAVSVETQEQNLLVHVIWQAQQTTFENYTTFVQLRDGERVIGDDDRQPSPPTSHWAQGEVIVENYTLPRPATGEYAVALGLYDAATGQRLRMRSARDQNLSDDQYVLPVVIP